MSDSARKVSRNCHMHPNREDLSKGGGGWYDVRDLPRDGLWWPRDTCQLSPEKLSSHYATVQLQEGKKYKGKQIRNTDQNLSFFKLKKKSKNPNCSKGTGEAQAAGTWGGEGHVPRTLW